MALDGPGLDFENHTFVLHMLHKLTYFGKQFQLDFILLLAAEGCEFDTFSFCLFLQLVTSLLRVVRQGSNNYTK